MLSKIKSYGKLIISVFLKIPLHFCYFLSGFTPRNPKLWLFGCWKGQKFRGNSKYLYLYVRENHPDIRIAWITKSRELNCRLRESGINAFYAYSLKGTLATIRSMYFIVTHGILDVNEFVSRKGIMINLEHSIFPIKDNSMPKGGPFLKQMRLYLRHPYALLIKLDYAITSSQFTAAATKHHYNIDSNRVIPLGTPKTDYLLEVGKENDKLDKKDDYAMFYRSSDKRRILFLPTWRMDPGFSIFNFAFNLNELDNLLKEIDGIIAFKFHPSTKKNVEIPDFSSYENILYFDYHGDEINKLLHRVDMLITDYSSIFADFLIYNKPIVFAKFDHVGYLRERVTYVDYDKDLPGPKAEDWPELIRCIRSIFVYENDDYKSQREEMRDLIYPQRDGKARERIVKYILSLSD